MYIFETIIASVVPNYQHNRMYNIMTYEADLPANPANKEYNFELRVYSSWSQTT